jgi:hypothetical protein
MIMLVAETTETKGLYQEAVPVYCMSTSIISKVIYHKYRTNQDAQKVGATDHVT